MLNGVVEMGSGGMTYFSSFMKTGTCVQAILRFCLSDLNGCNVGIIDARELWSAQLRRTQVDVRITAGVYEVCHIEMGSGSMIYVPNSLTFSSGI
jgi:hypothetical protein